MEVVVRTCRTNPLHLRIVLVFPTWEEIVPVGGIGRESTPRIDPEGGIGQAYLEEIGPVVPVGGTGRPRETSGIFLGFSDRFSVRVEADDPAVHDLDPAPEEIVPST